MNSHFLDERTPLGELLDLKSFQEVCRSFVELYRIGLKVFDGAGQKLVDITVGSSGLSDYLFTSGEGARRWTATIHKAKTDPLEEGKVHTVNCYSGARYLVMPLVYEMDVVGRAILGPFIPQELEELPPTITDLSGLDLEHISSLMSKIRRASDATVAKVLEHFVKVTEVLVFSAYKVSLTSRMHIESVRESFKELAAKNERLEESFQQLRELDQLKSNFLATVSHELRTPLTSIIGYAEMLVEGLAGPLTTEQLDYLRTIMDKGESLLELISSILDLTRIESGKLRINAEPFDLEAMIANAFSSVLPQAKRRGVELISKVASELPKPVLDEEKITQCVVNLLANAVKFTGEGGLISVSAGPTAHLPSRPVGRFDGMESYFTIVVRDSGIGIPKEQLPRVFESFYQVDGSSTREYGGAGLGLAIVRSYVEAHGGEIRVDSAEGEGTVFQMLLPLVYAPSFRSELDARRHAS